MRGDNSPTVELSRYWKFAWNDLAHLPPVGKPDYQPKNGAFRFSDTEGRFSGEHLESFPAQKVRSKLPTLGRCAFCGRSKQSNGQPLKLTSEHVLPEFLGAGLELPRASCNTCQNITAAFEHSIATEMFDPVRKNWAIEGKQGVIESMNFPADIGRETTDYVTIPLVHYPTILVLPFLYQAPSYSSRPQGSNAIFNFRLYNINANATVLQNYEIEKLSSQSIDTVRFCQMIAKIGHVYATHYHRNAPFTAFVADFVQKDIRPGEAYSNHYDHVGCLWQAQDKDTQSLHEIEVGNIEWQGNSIIAVRVRLFASCGMPSYYVTVGARP